MEVGRSLDRSWVKASDREPARASLGWVKVGLGDNPHPPSFMVSPAQRH
jgi:hypothetical protein